MIKENETNVTQVDTVAIDRELPWKRSTGAAVCDPHSTAGKR